MKKLLLLILLLGVSIQGFSQSGIYGIRGGLNISNLNFDDAPISENKHRNSIYIGVFSDFKLSEKVSIVPELQFSAEGANDENLHLDYIQAPILFKFKMSPKMRLAVGPQASLKVHKYEDGVKNIAYSAVGGLEYKINEMLFVDLRYTYGVSNIFDDYINAEAKNTNIQFGIGYQF
ncbi:MAG: porin family protein [Algibacter sp.]